MTVERLKNGADWMEEEVKKPLKKLKNEVVESKENIPAEVIKQHIDFYNKVLEMDLDHAKKQWLTSKEGGIIRKAVKRFIDDIKNHPNAYFMSVKKLQKIWVAYSTFDDCKDYGFIDDYELSKSLWATFKATKEEEALIDKYHILYE